MSSGSTSRLPPVAGARTDTAANRIGAVCWPARQPTPAGREEMTCTPYRLAPGGRIERARPVCFSLDGRAMTGCEGTRSRLLCWRTACAWSAGALSTIGRAGSLGRGRRAERAIDPGRGRANGAERRRDDHGALRGLVARRQNGWPSVEFDLMAINSLVAPCLLAGFYYKTLWAQPWCVDVL